MSSGKSTLQELRELNVRRQRESAPEPVHSPDDPADTESGNMTGHMTDNMTIQKDSHTDVLPSRRKASQRTRQPAIKTVDQTDDKTVGQLSIREAIKAAVQGGGGQAKPVLKTVTIKLSPELDKRVEDHCHETGRLKQDVIRDGLLLYFEAIEGDED